MIDPAEHIKATKSMTGIRAYVLDGLAWEWSDWVLCEISWRPSNPVHWCVISNVRGEKPDKITLTIMNPSYDDSGRDFVYLGKIHYLKPVKVIEEVKEKPSGYKPDR